MPQFPLSRDGRCPSCGTGDVAYVLINRHFAAGTLAPIFRILLKTHRAVVGLEQAMMTTELPTMICCGLCAMSPHQGGFNLDWRFTNLQAAFNITREMIEAEERQPVNVPWLVQGGMARLRSVRRFLPNAAPAVSQCQEMLCWPQSTTSVSAAGPVPTHSQAMGTLPNTGAGFSWQETIAAAVRSARLECERKQREVENRGSTEGSSSGNSNSGDLGRNAIAAATAQGATVKVAQVKSKSRFSKPNSHASLDRSASRAVDRDSQKHQSGDKVASLLLSAAGGGRRVKMVFGKISDICHLQSPEQTATPSGGLEKADQDRGLLVNQDEMPNSVGKISKSTRNLSSSDHCQSKAEFVEETVHGVGENQQVPAGQHARLHADKEVDTRSHGQRRRPSDEDHVVEQSYPSDGHGSSGGRNVSSLAGKGLDLQADKERQCDDLTSLLIKSSTGEQHIDAVDVKQSKRATSRTGRRSLRKSNNDVRRDHVNQEAHRKAPATPDVSPAVWEFYQQNVLKGQRSSARSLGAATKPASGKEDSKAKGTSEQADDDDQVESGGNALSGPDMDWCRVNVQQFLQAEDDKFLQQFDRRLVAERVARLKQRVAAGEQEDQASAAGSSGVVKKTDIVQEEMSEMSVVDEEEYQASEKYSVNPVEVHLSEKNRVETVEEQLSDKSNCKDASATAVNGNTEVIGNVQSKAIARPALIGKASKDLPLGTDVALHTNDVAMCLDFSDVIIPADDDIIECVEIEVSDYADVDNTSASTATDTVEGKGDCQIVRSSSPVDVAPLTAGLTVLSGDADSVVTGADGDLSGASYSMVDSSPKNIAEHDSGVASCKEGAVKVLTTDHVQTCTTTPAQTALPMIRGGLQSLISYGSESEDDSSEAEDSASKQSPPAAGKEAPEELGDNQLEKDESEWQVVDEVGESSPLVSESSSPVDEEVDGWEVVDEAGADIEESPEQECSGPYGKYLPQDAKLKKKQKSHKSPLGSQTSVQAQPAAAPAEYPVSMTGACPHCFSSDVIYLVVAPESKPDSDLPPLLRNLLLCRCAVRFPPSKDGAEIPSFMCRGCNYGFNLNWAATNLEAIFGVNDEPLEEVDPAVANALETICAEGQVGTNAAEPAGENVSTPTQIDQAQMTQSQWEIYWNNLSVEEQEKYRHWYYSQSASNGSTINNNNTAPEQRDDMQRLPPSEPQEDEEKKQKARLDQQKQVALREKQLLSIQPKEVRNLEALLSKIDSARQSENDSMQITSDGKEKIDSGSGSEQAGEQPWWQLLSSHPGASNEPQLQPSNDLSSGDEPVADGEENQQGINSDDSGTDEDEVDEAEPKEVVVQPVFATEYKEYTVRASFNRMTGKFQRLGDEEHWTQKGLPADRALRQMAHHFDPSYLYESADAKEPAAKRKKLSYKEVKKLKELKKLKKQKALVKQYA